MLIALIWKFDFSPFMVLIIAILNDGEFLVGAILKYIEHSLSLIFCAYPACLVLTLCIVIFRRNNYDNLKG
jgi:hypothetical protein